MGEGDVTELREERAARRIGWTVANTAERLCKVLSGTHHLI